MDGLKYNNLEISRIIGEPLDPRKPYPDIVAATCEVDTADPDEYVYYHVAALETDSIVTLTNSGAITSSVVSPTEPTAFTFIDMGTPEYYVKLTDLAKAKESVLARKLTTINRAMNGWENYQILRIIDAAATTASHFHDLQSGRTRFSYDDLIYMLEDVIDYGDNYVLIVGSTIDRDIKLWDWNDNKYSSMIEAFKDLGIEKIRQHVGQISLDTAATDIVAATTAYIVARDTEMGKPCLFVRKKLSDIELLGASIKQNGDKPERIIFASPNPITASGGTVKYLAVGLTGFESVVAACVNPYAISRFCRV